MILLIPNDPGYITAAAAAFPREYQHARVNPGGDMGDSGHIPALGAPDCVENFKLSISGHGTPDISGSGCKRIPRFKDPSSGAVLATDKAFTYLTVKKIGPYHFSFTIRISHHFRGGRHLHISFCVTSRAEFDLHTLYQFDLYIHLSDSLIIL